MLVSATVTYSRIYHNLMTHTSFHLRQNYSMYYRLDVICCNQLTWHAFLCNHKPKHYCDSNCVIYQSHADEID